jgi:hypothetical protein
MPAMKFTTPLGALVLFIIAAPALAQHTHGQGGCGKFEWDMAKELKVLERARADVAALRAKAETAPASIPLDQALRASLAAEKDVTLLVPPRRPSMPESFAGLFALRVPKAGTYRVSSNQRLWIEVVGPEGTVPTARFTMQADCEALRKSVAFALQPGKDYWIQYSGSAVQDPLLLVTEDR